MLFVKYVPEIKSLQIFYIEKAVRSSGRQKRRGSSGITEQKERVCKLMKNWKLWKKLKDKRITAGCVAVICALVIGGGAAVYDSAKSPELVFPTFTDPVLEVSLEDEETPLAAAPKVTTKTTKKTSTSKKNVTMKAAATKTCVKTLPAKKKTATKTTKKNSTTTVKTQTTVVTNVTEKYTLKSKKKLVTTKVTTTVKTTTTVVPTVTPTPVPQGKYEVNISSVAPKMSKNVLSAFQTLGFKVVVDPGSSYAGYFDARTRRLTMKKADDTVYHELGHFLAFAAGNVDTSTSFKAIYNAEKGKYNGTYKAYATQNSSEFFAECTRDYILRNASLKSACPQTYAAIEAAFSKITDSQIAKVKAVYGVLWK